MRRGGVVWFVIGLAVTVTLAVVVSRYASTQPDGLEYVAEREGFAQSTGEHPSGGNPLAGYGNGEAGGGIPVGVAGLVGVVAALGLGFGVFRIIRAPGRERDGSRR